MLRRRLLARRRRRAVGAQIEVGRGVGGRIGEWEAVSAASSIAVAGHTSILTVLVGAMSAMFMLRPACAQPLVDLGVPQLGELMLSADGTTIAFRNGEALYRWTEQSGVPEIASPVYSLGGINVDFSAPITPEKVLMALHGERFHAVRSAAGHAIARD